jgi:predicted  nucleic acid-binding Zn-ribbon protein
MEVTMDFKTFLENIKEEFNITMNKSFDKIEVFSRLMKLKTRVNQLNSEISHNKRKMGDYVYQNKDDFFGHEELAALIKKLEILEATIEETNEEIAELREKNKEEGIAEEPTQD